MLDGGNAGRGTTEVAIGAHANLDEHSGLPIAADQIQFAAANPVVASDDDQPPSDEEAGGSFLSGSAADLRSSHGHRTMVGMSPDNMTNALYVVATPIGNLADITLRALEILRGTALIACEDTRHSRHLLDHYGITAKTLALHEHNERAATEQLIAALSAGTPVALISDAGTPGISDPGSRACAAVRAAGFAVVPLPGPNAAITAFSAAGLQDGRFLFAGFLPTKTAARRQEIEALKGIAAALVFYEAPHRIAETVADLAAVLEPQRSLVIARELTKMFEQIAVLPLADAPAWLAADDNRRRGEFVLVVAGPPPGTGIDAESDRVLRLLLEELPVKQAAKLAAGITGHAKNALYDRALQLKA